MGENNIVRGILDSELLTCEQLAKSIDCSVQSVQSWSSGRRVPSKKWMTKLISTYPNYAHLNNKEKQSSNMEHTNKMSEYVIDLQRDKIQTLKDEVDSLKLMQSSSTMEDIVYDTVTPDFETKVTIKFSLTGLDRKIEGDLTKLANQLEMPKGIIDQYLCKGKWFKMSDHPINDLMTDQTQKTLYTTSNALKGVIKMLKFLNGTHHFSFPVSYKYEGKVVHTVSHCKIMQLSVTEDFIVETKNVIFES